ncbi:MAG: hypothetical protein P4L55_01925 [Syntrophobacteraceae bacterium]|nr:hypothetical protein [Syntrophobacteraceae bacterium]
MCLQATSLVAVVDIAVDIAVDTVVYTVAYTVAEWGIREVCIGVSDRVVAPEEEVAVSKAPVVLMAGALQCRVIMGIHMVEVAAIIIMDPTPMVGMAVTTGMEAMHTAAGEVIVHAMLVAPITITDTTIMAGMGITEGIGTMVAGHIPQPSCMMLFGCHIQAL